MALFRLFAWRLFVFSHDVFSSFRLFAWRPFAAERRKNEIAQTGHHICLIFSMYPHYLTYRNKMNLFYFLQSTFCFLRNPGGDIAIHIHIYSHELPLFSRIIFRSLKLIFRSLQIIFRFYGIILSFSLFDISFPQNNFSLLYFIFSLSHITFHSLKIVFRSDALFFFP